MWWTLCYLLAIGILATASVQDDTGKTIICKAEQFPCGNTSFCLDRIFHCDGVIHCQLGEDEENCDDIHGSLSTIMKDLNQTPLVNVMALPSYYNCTLSNIPIGCKCHYLTWALCVDVTFKNIPQSLSQATKLVLKNNSITAIHPSDFQQYNNLRVLYIEGNNLRTLPSRAFSELNNLLKLFLNENKIENITHDAFQGLNKLHWLYLKGNKLKELDTRIFNDLPSLTMIELSFNNLTLINTAFPAHKKLAWIDLQNNQITKIEAYTFSSVKNLEALFLQNNKIHDIDQNALSGLKKLTELSLANNQLINLQHGVFRKLNNLSKLNLDNNPLISLPLDTFHELPNLKSLSLSGIEIPNIDVRHFITNAKLEFIYFRKFYYCSYAPFVRICIPKTDGLSSVDHLLVWPTLRFSVWIVALMTCMGNTIVLTWRVLSRKEDHVLSLFIKNLAVADFLMGIYLIAIGAQDLAFRDRYNKHAHAWMSSWQCTLCGVLAMVSCEVSVFILSLITVERYRCIRSNVRVVSVTAARYSLVAIWGSGILLAVFPLFHLHRNHTFYAVNGLCFPLHIDDPYMSGWQYSAFVFLGVNFTAVVLIIILYLRMFLIIKDDRQRARPVMIKKHEDAVLAMRFFFIVLTDCLCWIPIVVIKVIALSQITISDSLYACVVVFILPINSALNPVIYTMAAPTEMRRKIYKWFQRAVSCINRLEYLIVFESKTSTSSQLTQSLTTTEGRSSSNGSILQGTGIQSPIVDCHVEVIRGNQDNPPIVRQGLETML